MKVLKLFILLTLSVSVFYSCNDKLSDDEIEIQTSLFPLNIGNNWTYDLIYKGDNPYETEISKTEIQYSYKIDGQEGFSFQEYVKGQPISLFNNDNEGNLIESFFYSEVLVHKTIYLKNNIKEGDKWTYKSVVYTDDDYSNYDIEEQEMTCISSDTLISTPYGDYHCKGISYHPGGMQEDGTPNHTFIIYASPNIGIVKVLHYEHNGGKTYLFTEKILTDHTVK